MHLVRTLRPLTFLHFRMTYNFASRIPTFNGKPSAETNSINILHSNEAEGNVPSHKLK